jgi:CrcB protein
LPRFHKDSHMRSYLLVALGGAIGAVSRFAVGGWVAYQVPGVTFPLSTFVVNVVGCCVAGALTGAAERWDVLSADLRLLLFTGILGGFTTFSAFGLESTLLLRKGHVSVALLYIGLSVLAGVLAFWGALLVTKAP